MRFIVPRDLAQKLSRLIDNLNSSDPRVRRQAEKTARFAERYGTRRPLFQHPRWGECHSASPQSMPKMFDELANYNSQVAKGILHREEYRARMAALQVQFDEWKRETWQP